MGNYLNPGNDMFYKMVHSEIYVDKTGLIGKLNQKNKLYIIPFQ